MDALLNPFACHVLKIALRPRTSKLMSNYLFCILEHFFGPGGIDSERELFIGNCTFQLCNIFPRNLARKKIELLCFKISRNKANRCAINAVLIVK